MNRIAEIWDDIVSYMIATEEELQLVTYISGYTEETLNDVIFVRTGYRDIDQYREAEWSSN